MIADAHCHAWPTWPYANGGPSSTVDALLRELDTHAVERALVVGARLPGQDDDNEYLLAAVAAYPDRLWCAVEVDAFWRPEYGTPDAARRLRRWTERGGVSAAALFPDPAAPDWLTSGPGAEVVRFAADNGLVLSIAAPPSLLPDIRQVAQRHPSLPLMLHHLGMVALSSPTAEAQVAALVDCAAHPRVYLKLSGLHYAGENSASRLVAPLLAAYGSRRLLWGSDYPSSTRFGVGYPEALAVAETLPDSARPEVLGANLARLMESATSAPPRS